MRIASLFQRRRWVGLRPVRLVPARVLAGLFLFGCFFELEELVEPAVGGFGNAGAIGRGGGGGIAQGGSPNGGSGGSFVQPEECPTGQKLCGGELCVPMTIENGCGNPTCEPCAQPAQGRVSCNQDTRACQVDSCDFGFADCDGNLLAYTGADAGNGCEYPFGTIQTVAQPLEVRFANDIRLDDGGSRIDWTGIPAYPLEATCPNCLNDFFPSIIAQNEAPPRADLDAYVRVAWDTDFFYVLGEAFDNSIFHDGLSLGLGQCQNGAPCEDAFRVFFDGRNDRATGGVSSNDDFHVFLGLSGKAFRPSGAPVSNSEVQFTPTIQSGFCYRIEAQVSWSYIVSLQGLQGIPDVFPPKSGQQYGFNVSVNDWDPPVSGGAPERQSQLFYVNPGDNYHQVSAGYIPMLLSGGPDADAGP